MLNDKRDIAMLDPECPPQKSKEKYIIRDNKVLLQASLEKYTRANDAVIRLIHVLKWILDILEIFGASQAKR